MTHFVVDASVAVEYLLRTPLGLTVADMIEGASLTAPELMDAEVVSVLRRAVLSGRLEEARARMVVADHDPLAGRPHLSPLPWRRWLGSTTGMSAPMMPSTSLLPAPTVSLS